MSYSAEAIRAFWVLMRMGKAKPFLVRRLLQRLDRGEISEQAAIRVMVGRSIDSNLERPERSYSDRLRAIVGAAAIDRFT